jgi:hypothetical protein
MPTPNEPPPDTPLLEASSGEPPAEAWRVLAASVTGRSHAAVDRGNEDAVQTARLAGGTLVLALADGAGSAGRAGEGARLAVGTAVEVLAGELHREGLEALLRTALREVRRAMAGRARELRVRPRDFACTLLLAVARGDDVAVLQLGDGAVVARGPDGWQRLVGPQRGRYAGETVFVTSRGAAGLAEVEVHPLASVKALALLSDGLEPVATDVASGRPHAPFFDPLVAFAGAERAEAELEAELTRFLGSDRLQSRSSDDLSLILALNT